jgi:starvation-inducible outer membrane lipoprotein
MAQLNNVKTQKTTKTKNYKYKIVNINMNSYEIWTIQRQKKDYEN